MYRLTYEEYSPLSWGLRSMGTASQYREWQSRQLRTLVIDAANDEEAAAKAAQFIRDSGPANAAKFKGGAWPHTVVEFVNVHVLPSRPGTQETVECAHGHKTRVVGCVSCVLVFDRQEPTP